MVCPPLRNLKICLCFFIHMFNTTDPPRNFCLFLYISSIETCIQCVGSSTRSGVRSIFSVSSMCTSLSLSLSLVALTHFKQTIVTAQSMEIPTCVWPVVFDVSPHVFWTVCFESKTSLMLLWFVFWDIFSLL